MELLKDPDFELIEACRDPSHEGFESAFERLYLRYRDRVYSVAYRITGNDGDAMDVVQESFGQVFRKLDSFRAGSLFSTWLFRIAVNSSIDFKRREKSRTRQQDLLEDAGVVEDPSLGPVDNASVHEMGSQMQQAIGHLSPKLRSVLALRYLEDMSYEQLAATLQLSLGTVKSRLARAHVSFERILRDHYPQLHRDHYALESDDQESQDTPLAEGGA